MKQKKKIYHSHKIMFRCFMSMLIGYRLFNRCHDLCPSYNQYFGKKKIDSFS